MATTWNPKNVGAGIIFFCLLLVAFWLRIQSAGELPIGQFTETDAYFYYWQAQLVSEHGQLPARDMHRWVPFGRDLGQTLNLYPYTLAYTQKAIARFFPNVSLYHVVLYAPVVCFCIGLAALCLFLYHGFGLLFSGIAGILLATLPGAIERSTAGFGDRDAWCLMLGILAITTYLASLQTQKPCRRFLWTLASGFTVFLGGLSWEGFGVFLSILLVVELWRFLTSETEERLSLFILWVCFFVPTLYLASPAYRSGYGFATHLFAFMLVPPLTLLCLRCIRYLLMTKTPWAEALKPHSRTLALGLTLTSITLAIAYVFMQLDTFASTTVPLSQNQLMQTVTELKTPNFRYWIFRYGSLFILGSIGIILTSKQRWDQTCMLVPLALFIITTFFREPLEKFLWTESHGTFFFSIAIACCAVAFLITAGQQKTQNPHHVTNIAFTAWFLFWIALARDAKRYDFFIGVPLAFFTTEFTQFFLTYLIERNVKQNVLKVFLKTALTIMFLTAMLFWELLGGYANRSIYAATRMRSATPGHNPVAKAFWWMKAELPHTAVVAAHWRYGSQLNVLAGVKTIIDQDHYLQHWIRLYNRHVLHAQSEREALEFLKTHTATHLMLTGSDPRDAFLRGQLSEAFVPVYLTDNLDEAAVKVWEIRYPPDIKPNPKYLATEPVE